MARGRQPLAARAQFSIIAQCDVAGATFVNHRKTLKEGSTDQCSMLLPARSQIDGTEWTIDSEEQ
jgi:hypothetical protein